MPTVWTIGYERLLPPQLVAELQAAGVERVLDVRYRPQSRRPGMSKTRLGHLLEEHGIAYEHRRALGTPPDLRHDFHAGRIEQARAGYRAYVEANAPEALDALAADVVLLDALGPILAQSYLTVRRSEWETYSAEDDAFEQQGHFSKY